MNVDDSERERYHELTAYTLSHTDPAFIHQYAVDAFAAQTADDATKPITLAFALVGLYLAAERQYSGRQVQRVHTLLARRRKRWPKFDSPEFRGAITVRDVMDRLSKARSLRSSSRTFGNEIEQLIQGAFIMAPSSAADSIDHALRARVTTDKRPRARGASRRR